MQREEFYSVYMKSVIMRVDKREARKMYDKGYTIYLQSCTMRFDNKWQSACPVSKKDGRDFDSVVNDYTYYNCDSARGKYPHYYVKKFMV